jgi:triosephosphate isomerase
MFKLILNLKLYQESSGKNIEKFLNSICSENITDSLLFAVPPTRIYLASTCKNIISQHVDSESFGSYTGHIIMEDLLSMGVNTSLLNHSEKRVEYNIIEKTLNLSNKLDFNLVICGKNPMEIEEFCKMGAKTVAYEPPELIGGNTSVSVAKPEIILDTVNICEKYDCDLLVGAGIKSREDVYLAKKMGASGILVSSGVVKAKNPLDSLNSLMI